MDRITRLERQRRDDTDSLQNELNHHRKLLEKFSAEQQKTKKSIPLHMYSSPEYDTSLYDEVQFDNQPWRSSHEPTNFQALFAPVYEKLRVMID